MLASCHSIGNLDDGQKESSEGQLEIATLGNFQGVGDCLGMACKEAAHLIRRLQEEFLRLKSHPLGVVHRRLGLDAEKNLVRLCLRLTDVMDVVGRHERKPQTLAEIGDVAIEIALKRKAMVLDLEIVAILKGVRVPCNPFFRRGKIAFENEARNFAAGAA